MGQNLFVGRENEMSDFINNYVCCLDEKNTVVQYYGIPGIGKTTFSNELYKRLKGLECNVFYYSLKQEMRPTKVGILQGMAKKFSEEGKYTFPLFYTALTMYYVKLTGSNLEVANGKFDAISDKAPIVSDVLSIIGGIGTGFFIGTSALTIFDRVVSIYKKTKYKLEQKRYEEELTELENLDVEKIENNLEKYFILDLKNNIKNSDEKRIYIILDTYELIKNTELDGSDYYGDDWIRNSSNSLVNKVPNSTWIFVGRNALEWNENYCINYSKSSPIELLPLERKYVIEYFDKKGIAEEKLRDDMFNLTKGLPLFMELCANRYTEIVENGGFPTMVSLGDDLSIVTIRFLKNMDPISIDVAYLLAVLSKWTDQEVYGIANLMSNILAFSVPSYNKIIDQSFIVSDEENKRFMQDVVRDTIYKNLKEITGLICIKNIRTACFRYLVQNEALPEKVFFDSYINYLENCLNEDLEIREVLDKSTQNEIDNKLLTRIEMWREPRAEQYFWTKKLLELTIESNSAEENHSSEYNTILYARYLYEIRHMGRNSEAIDLSKSIMQNSNCINKDRIRVELVHAYLMDRNKHKDARNILKKINIQNLEDENGIRLYYYARKSLENKYDKRMEYLDKLIELYAQNGESDYPRILSLKAEKLGLELPKLNLDDANKKYKNLLDEIQKTSGKNSLMSINLESQYYYGFYCQAAIKHATEINSEEEIVCEIEKIKKRLEEIEKENPYVIDSNYVFYIRYAITYLLMAIGKFKSANIYLQQNYRSIERNDALISEKKLLDDLYKQMKWLADESGLHTYKGLILVRKPR